MALCVLLNKTTKRELLENMTSQDLTDWIAYFSLRPDLMPQIYEPAPKNNPVSAFKASMQHLVIKKA